VLAIAELSPRPLEPRDSNPPTPPTPTPPHNAGCCSHGAGGAHGLAARDPAKPSPMADADMPPTGDADADARPPCSATASMGLGRCGCVMPSLLPTGGGAPAIGIHPGNIGPAAGAEGL